MSGRAKVALITGSTSGIGLATAHAIAKRGIDVIITGFGDEATINGIVSDIKNRHGVKVQYVAADLSKLSDIESLWSTVTKIYPNGIDILVNNAGFIHVYPVEYVPENVWNVTVAVMLTAPFQLIKRALPAMKKKGYGRIVNVSSTAGVVGEHYLSAYTAAKHGLIGLTKGVALETAAHGITCNAVCPGPTETTIGQTFFQSELQEGAVPIEDVLKKFIPTPTKQNNTTEQVAELIEFLCLSNASSQMTGAAYLIDGGLTAQ